MDTIIGIYKITNKVTKESYIGQSRNIEKRWQSHKTKAFNEKDHSYNTPLYRAFRKYGVNNFSFEIIEQCKVAELDKKEKYWIKKYDTFFNGYNLTLGGDGRGNEIKKQSVIGVIRDLENTDLKHQDIADKWNISIEMVQGINTGRYWRQDRDYPIQKRCQKKKQIEYICKDCGAKITKGSVRCVSCANKSRRTIQNKIDRNTLKNLIRTTPFTTIAKQYNISDNAIRKWCDSYNLPRTKKEINSYTDKEWELI